MNYPFPIYPNGILSGYNSFNRYKTEVIRLYHFLIYLKDIFSLKETKNLIIINFGSAGEELIYYIHKNPDLNIEYSEYYQWRQIHPTHIENFINKYKTNLRIHMIVISPDKYQEDIDYIPKFMHENIITDDLTITYDKINNQKYQYKNEHLNINIDIDFFNCLMPSIEKNSRKILSNNNIILSQINENIYEINNFNQTAEDIQFINDFYEKFEEICVLNDYKNNFLIIQNFATFRNLHILSEMMFSHSMQIIIKYSIIFLEWKNIKNNIVLKNITCCIINNICLFNKKIKYSHYYCDDDMFTLFVDCV
jgi:hypothetical protein